jgi:ribonuclease BN (tRNA processing enzyme)
VVAPGPRAYGPLTVRQARVDHGDSECWATRVGDTLCYTADTAPCLALDDLAAGCVTLLAEASGLDADAPLRRHLTAGDAGRLAAGSGASLLILPHLRPWQDHAALLTEAARHARRPALLAAPALRLSL